MMGKKKRPRNQQGRAGVLEALLEKALVAKSRLEADLESIRDTLSTVVAVMLDGKDIWIGDEEVKRLQEKGFLGLRLNREEDGVLITPVFSVPEGSEDESGA